MSVHRMNSRHSVVFACPETRRLRLVNSRAQVPRFHCGNQITAVGAHLSRSGVDTATLPNCGVRDASCFELSEAPFDRSRDALLIAVLALVEAFRKPKTLPLQCQRRSQLMVLEKTSMRESLLIAARGYC